MYVCLTKNAVNINMMSVTCKQDLANKFFNNKNKNMKFNIYLYVNISLNKYQIHHPKQKIK